MASSPKVSVCFDAFRLRTKSGDFLRSPLFVIIRNVVCYFHQPMKIQPQKFPQLQLGLLGLTGSMGLLGFVGTVGQEESLCPHSLQTPFWY